MQPALPSRGGVPATAIARLGVERLLEDLSLMLQAGVEATTAASATPSCSGSQARNPRTGGYGSYAPPPLGGPPPLWRLLASVKLARCWPQQVPA